MYLRLLENEIIKAASSNKVIVLCGPGQIGKTTLATKIGKLHEGYLYLNCDEPDVRAGLTDKNSSELKRIIGDYKFVVIDEAQRVPNIGLTLKLIVDNNLTDRIIATGSSAFELANRINEPLTGRKIVFTMLPLTYTELTNGLSPIEKKRLIYESAVYGSYPAVVNSTSRADKLSVLRELVESSLYKDILEFQRIRNPTKIRDLLRALAFQVGSEVSYSEIGQQIGIDRQTVESYVDLLEQSFIIYRLPPLTRNPRKEISRLKKIYFYDNGVRNTLVNRLDEFSDHPDRGALWESWALTERIKLHKALNDPRMHYFWRLQSGAEIDLVEDNGEGLTGLEYKIKDKRASAPESWGSMYPNSAWRAINPDNFDEEGLK